MEVYPKRANTSLTWDIPTVALQKWFFDDTQAVMAPFPELKEYVPKYAQPEGFVETGHEELDRWLIRLDKLGRLATSEHCRHLK